MKVAFVVEGRTEQILVRDYLVRQFDYQDIYIFCIATERDGFDKVKIHGFGDKDATNHFYILNANSDVQVIPKIIQMEDFFNKEGYEKIIGLRDMFSEEYENESPKREIKDEVNEKVKKQALADLALKAQDLDKIEICFSIMETETWFLGLYEIFERIDSKLTPQFILENLKINLEEIDPETTVFHPYPLVRKIFQLANKDYRKKKEDIEKITSQLSKQDYETLLARNKCNSFNTFHETIFPQV